MARRVNAMKARSLRERSEIGIAWAAMSYNLQQNINYLVIAPDDLGPSARRSGNSNLWRVDIYQASWRTDHLARRAASPPVRALGESALGLCTGRCDVGELKADGNFESTDATRRVHGRYRAGVSPTVINLVALSASSHRSGGRASSIHGTSRQRSSAGANSSSSASVSGK